MSSAPPIQGLYHPQYEHDACGMGFVVDLNGNKSHEIIQKGIQILINLTHRGACGCDPETGDGARRLIQMPHKFFEREAETLLFSLPQQGEYALGMTFLRVATEPRVNETAVLVRIMRAEGLTT